VKSEEIGRTPAALGLQASRTCWSHSDATLYSQGSERETVESLTLPCIGAAEVSMS